MKLEAKTRLLAGTLSSQELEVLQSAVHARCENFLDDGEVASSKALFLAFAKFKNGKVLTKAETAGLRDALDTERKALEDDGENASMHEALLKRLRA